jgi:glycosyltransferase involved in cell wall biosynthesis
MKLFYICYEDLGIQAAWTTHVKEVVENLRKRGCEIVLFAPKFGRLKTDADITFVWIPTIRVRILSEYFYYLLLFFYLVSHQIRLRADVFYVREMSLCLPVALASKLLKVPHVVEVNGPVLEERKLIGTSGAKLFFHKLFQRMNLVFCTRTIAVTERLREYITRYHDISDRKIVTIENGVNTDLFRPHSKRVMRRRLGFREDCYYLTYVGSFYPHHSLDSLVRMLPLLLKQLDSVRVVLAGDGYVRSEIQDLAAELGLVRYVQFLGSVNYQQVPDLINASDLCIMFHVEGDKTALCPLKLLEYLSCGRPVILNWKALSGALFKGGGMGVEIDLKNRQDAAYKIVSLLKSEPLRAAMGRRARRFIEEHYSWSRAAREIVRVCESVKK